MKILLIQLARLGDIYMTWPALRAIRRKYPQAEIHLLTRPRFEAAVRGLDVLDKHHSLPVRFILEPLVQNEADVEQSRSRLQESLAPLLTEKFDWVINLTFSPVSSFLTHFLSGPTTKVSGYTRHSDGFLDFADDVSAYFYAQVGIGRSNRVHIADIFASMLELEYVESDWQAPIAVRHFDLPDNYIAVHVGASETQKSLSSEQWVKFLRYFTGRKPNTSIVLIGSSAEKAIAQGICEHLPSITLMDLVGETEIQDIFTILQRSIMLVGCDSAPIHMASLTDTATYNLSIGRVNFWETGPKATHSFIYRAESEETFVATRAAEILSLLIEGNIPADVICRGVGLTSFQVQEEPQQRFQWDLAQAIYLSTAFPVSEDIRFYEAVLKLEEVNRVVMERLKVQGTQPAHLHHLLDAADEIIRSISQLVPDVSPIVNWYQAEKIRIAPGANEVVLQATLSVHQTLEKILKVYILEDEVATNQEVGHGKV